MDRLGARVHQCYCTEVYLLVSLFGVVWVLGEFDGVLDKGLNVFTLTCERYQFGY